ncbi:MAG: O-antigen ligase family protein [Candidatus Omnitrophota bacterium]
MALLMFILALCAIIALINPFFGLLVVVALIPQSLIPALTGSLAGIFSMFTPIKLIGGITFLSTLMHKGFGENLKFCFSRPAAKAFLFFLIYLVINGFAMPSFATRENFTVFISIFFLGFATCSLVDSEKRFRSVLMVVMLSYLVSAVHAIHFFLISGDEFQRMSGNAFDPNYFAFVAISFFAVKSYKNKIMRLLLIFLSAVLTGALITTLSRGGLIGMAFIFVVGVLRSKRKFLAIVISSVLLVGILNVMPDSVWQRFRDTKIESDHYSSDIASTQRRFLLAKAAWEIFLDHPVFGIGIGNYYYECRKYQPIHAGRAHNMYLEILAEMGIVGGFLFLLIFFRTLKSLKTMGTNEGSLQSYMLGIYIGLFAFLIPAIFLHAQHDKVLWLLVFLTLALENIYQKTRLDGTIQPVREGEIDTRNSRKYLYSTDYTDR